MERLMGIANLGHEGSEPRGSINTLFRTTTVAIPEIEKNVFPKTLCVAVPQVPSYVNAGHSLPPFEVAAYLRHNFQGADVTAIDASKGDISLRDMERFLHQEQFGVIAIMSDLGSSPEGLRRFIRYARQVSPDAKLITFGRQVNKIPKFYQQYDLDAIVESGDYEAGVRTFIEYTLSDETELPGVAIRQGDIWMRPSQPGLLLSPEEWVLPDIDEINYSSYDRLYEKDENKFCGIPERRELVVPVARGCPIGCNFCEVWQREGLKERRLSVESTMSYIKNSFAKAEAESERVPTKKQFEYVAFYAPTFTLNKRWVRNLSMALIEEEQSTGKQYPWKCTTTLAHLDEKLIEQMAKSGCKRISVGVETFGKGKQNLPQVKRIADERFSNVASWCQQFGVELNCFAILGLPGDTIDGAEYTAERVREAGARYRPTVYEPPLSDDMTEEHVLFATDRGVLPHSIPVDDAKRLNALLLGEEHPTQVMHNIQPRNL